MSSADFFRTVPASGRILVLDLGFLGDTIHLIPALAAIRRALPQAGLEVMVAEHVKGILAVCPWLDGIHGYPRFPQGPRWFEDLGRVRDLHAGKFDAVINLNGSDRSSILTRLTGAPLRLGRVPPKTSWFWRHCFTHTVDVPHGTKPVFQQRLEALSAAGFPIEEGQPLFPIEIPVSAARGVLARLGDERPFIHLSPFATLDEKELPAAVLADFLNALKASRPDVELVISTAPNEREQAKLANLRAQLKFTPWRVFAGDLDLVEFAALIKRARLHLGGDSGALHVALMTGTPTISWWREYAGRVEWMPPGPAHTALIGHQAAKGLEDIPVPALLTAVASRLD